MSTKREEIIEKLKEATKELSLKYGDKIVALGLFGSYARGEETERSDIDILVVVSKWKRGMERRYLIYDVLHKHLKKDITLIDIDLDDVNDLIEGKRSITSIMLNIAYDLVPIYDPHNILRKLKEVVTRVIKELNLERYKIGRAYGWKRRDGKPLVPLKE